MTPNDNKAPTARASASKRIKGCRRVADTGPTCRLWTVPAFPVPLLSVTFKQAMNDYAGAPAAGSPTDFQPGATSGRFSLPAKPMEHWASSGSKWPGHGLGDNTIYQFVEGRYMTADEVRRSSSLTRRTSC